MNVMSLIIIILIILISNDTLLAMSFPHYTTKPMSQSSYGMKTCYTNSHKYTILQNDEYKLRENNIHRLSTSIEHPKLHLLKKSDAPAYILQYDLPITNVKTYLLEHYCSHFILYTIINQCCNNIALYHGLLNCHHSNASISNFDIYKNHICKLSDIDTDDKTLTLQSKIDDYDMLFDSYLEVISHKNEHFTNIASMYRETFMQKLAPSQSPEPARHQYYPEEPNPPSPLLLTSTSETSSKSG